MMRRREALGVIGAAGAAVAGGRWAAADQTEIKPVEEIVNVAPQRSVFRVGSVRKPIVLKSSDEAAEHFGEEALAELRKQVAFGKQVLVVFAWRGSGQDKLSYEVLESLPEQVAFRYEPGRTRDLRPHAHVFALRADVKWRNPE